VADHLSRDDCRRCTYHRPFRPFRGAAPYVRIHTNASGLAALGHLHCQLGWRIELFHSSRRTPLCILELISDQRSFQELQPATMRVSCGCRRLLSCEMPHTVCLSPVGYSTESQDNVRTRMRPPPLALRHHPCRQGSDVWRCPWLCGLQLGWS